MSATSTVDQIRLERIGARLVRTGGATDDEVRAYGKENGLTVAQISHLLVGAAQQRAAEAERRAR